MSTMIHRITTIAALGLSLGASSGTRAEPIPVRASDQIDLLTYSPPQVYTDQLVVGVTTTNQQQLDAMLELVESVWDESTGVGPLSVQIKRSNLPALTELGIPYQVLIEDLQSSTNADWTQMVRTQRHINQLVDQRQQHQGRGIDSVHDDLWFANYKQLNEIAAYIDNIAQTHPELATTSIIGQSLEGRDMFALTISGADTPENPKANRPVVFLFSTVHAREWIAPMTTAYYASKLIEDYQSDPRVQAILDSMQIMIVPVGNPDGYVYTWTDYRFWRKNRRDNPGSSMGVDINRNWGYAWGGPGASASPSSDTYRGSAPFSEPETQVLRDAALSHGSNLVANLEYHSFSQLILYPFGHTHEHPDEPDRTYFELLTREMSTIIRSESNQFYNPIQADDLYLASGVALDWFYGELGINSLIVELRPDIGGFNPPPEIILPNAQENYEAAKRYLEHAVEPLSFWHRPAPTSPAQSPQDLTLRVFDGQQEFDESSVVLYTRTDPMESFVASPMTPSSEVNEYTATIEPLDCGVTLEYYFQASTTSAQTYTLPHEGASAPFASTTNQLVIAQSDNIESETGWTVGLPTDTATSGHWTRMDPEQVIDGSGIITQPENNHTPEGSICWITDGTAGFNENDRDVDNGSTTLTSPIFDATRHEDPYFTFWYWLYRSDDRYPSLRVDLSNDNGDSWVQADHPDAVTDQWNHHQIRISNEIEPTDQMRIRFVAFDNGVDGVVEVGIDDVSIAFYGCPSENPADLNNDGELDFIDIQAFLSYFAAQNPEADLNNDGEFDFLDIAAFISAFTSTGL